MVLRSEATTGGPMVMFGTKCPSITSRCKTVPPPSSAAFASAPNCAKLADNIEGASSMTEATVALLPLARNSIIRESRPSLSEIGYHLRIRLLQQTPREEYPSFHRHGNSSALVTALARQFEQIHHVERPFRSHRQRRFAKNGVAQIGIEVAVI